MEANDDRVDVRLLQHNLEARLFGEAPMVQLGRFTILDRLGDGGMGTVYAAYDPDLDRKIAVKVLRPSARTQSRRLLKEAKALAKLSHASVITVHEVGLQADQLFIAMEFAPGGTLAQWAEGLKDAPDRFERILARMRECIDALAAAHELGIVHRDFKPHNVLIGADDRARVADFGLASSRGAIAGGPASVPSKETEHLQTSPATIGAAGTPAYMAPEQFEGQADARSDQFALCVTFYELLYGRRPWQVEPFDTLAERVAAGPPRPEGAADVPAWMFDVLSRGLALDPQQRYPDMRALLSAIDQASRPRRGIGAVLSLGALAAAVAVAAWATTKTNEATTPAVDPCDDGREALEPVWGEAQRQAVAAAFEATGQPISRGIWERVESPIDAWAAEWKQAKQASCEATRVYGTQDERMDRTRQACLDRQLERAAEIVGEAREVTAATVYSAYRLPARLPNVQDCAETDNLVFGDGRYDLTSPIIETIFDKLEEAKELKGDDDYDAAKALLVETAILAEEARLPGVAARVYGALARRTLVAGDYAIADAYGRAALGFAEQLGDRNRIVVCWHRLAKIAHEADENDKADFYFERAQSYAQHARTELQADLTIFAALRSQRAGKHDETARLRLRAAELLESIGIRRDAMITQLRNATPVLMLAGDLERAEANARRVLELSKTEYGDTHPRTLYAHLRVAEVMRSRGRYDESLEHTTFIADNLPPPGTMANRDRHVALMLSVHGTALRLAGKDDEAIALLETALADAEREGGKRSDAAKSLRGHYALALLHVGRLEEAAVQYRGQIAACENSQAHSCSATQQGGNLANYANVLSRLGRHDEAIAQFEEAWVILVETSSPDSQRRGDNHILAARIYFRAGRLDEARAHVQQGRRIAGLATLTPKTIAELEDLESQLGSG